MTARRHQGRKRPKRSWKQDPEGRRASVLAAAGRAFGEKGYRDARVEDIAREASVAEGTVFHLFGSKRGLLVAVGEAYGRGMARAAFGGIAGELEAGLVQRIVSNIFAYVRETPGPLAAFLLTGDPEEGAAAQDANRSEMLAAIEAFLARAVEVGVVPALHPRVAAELQFGLVESALRDCFLRRGGAEQPIYEAEAARCLAAYLGVSS